MIGSNIRDYENMILWFARVNHEKEAWMEKTIPNSCGVWDEKNLRSVGRSRTCQEFSSIVPVAERDHIWVLGCHQGQYMDKRGTS